MVRSRIAVATGLLVILCCSAADSWGQTKGSNGGLVLQVQTRRVPLDIVVTDKQGKPVLGLKKSDFKITEDKKTQKALTFEYIDGSTSSYLPPELPELPANTYLNLPKEPERGPLYVLYYDMVNTPMDDQMMAYKQLLEFVDHAQPGTRIALFANVTGLHMMQGFTSDHTLLRAAINYRGPGPHIPNVFLYGRNYGFEDPGAALSNLKFMAEYLKGIPGRKNLLWVSTEFPIPVGPTVSGHNSNTGVGGGFSSSTMQLNDLTYLEAQEIKETYAAMESSQVALYPVDVEGQNPENDPGDQLVKGEYEDAIAEATGGHAYHGSNRLQTMLDSAVENGENYYSLTYSPTNTKYDGLERHIEVMLTQKGDYKLNYRTLYYAVADQPTAEPTHKSDVLQTRFVAAKTADTLYANIEHGAPMLHDLVFSAQLATEGVPTLASADQMAKLEDSPAFFRARKKDKVLKPLTPVKLQRYMIDYGVIDPQLKALAKSKQSPATLEFAAAAYDADGRLLNSMLNEGLAPTGADAGSKPGALFHAQQELDVPPGAAWIRLAVRDKLSDRTGTVEVQLPLAKETQAKLN